MEPVILTTAKEFFKFRDRIEEPMIIRNRLLLNKEKQLIAIYQPPLVINMWLAEYQPQEKNQINNMKKQKPSPAQKIFEEVLPEEVEQFIKIIKPVKGVDKIINKEDERSNG